MQLFMLFTVKESEGIELNNFIVFHFFKINLNQHELQTKIY